ncbi:MAG: XRE family transcriptional regulator [Mesorhizobium sp.]|uniref:helix-turn-helix domain-containing protein n=1 Tax=Mesorhizobium sp. TaxID=1871066 RepID=UPI000FEA9D9A|nr:helix-turn-helix transcriptional regulator [Mesorhizobium sp.]RWN20377.1 MAG: XRE family transcriptional regulator [Mesorhizobium sp.]RWN47157.1 MAG: XRE family transcriptional regulator [Mesorhizobium sp.]
MMSFQEIDRRRIAAGLTRKALYERAGVDGETWRRLSKGKNLPNTGTLIKLTSALDALVAETTGEQANG